MFSPSKTYRASAESHKYHLTIRENAIRNGNDYYSISRFPLDMQRALTALYDRNWGARCGLYIVCVPGMQIKNAPSFEVMLRPLKKKLATRAISML